MSDTSPESGAGQAGKSSAPMDPTAGAGASGDRLPADQALHAREIGDQGTGHPAVDRVLRDLDGLEQRPVAEHAAAYQQAHERLTRALDPVETRLAETRGSETGGSVTGGSAARASGAGGAGR